MSSNFTEITVCARLSELERLLGTLESLAIQADIAPSVRQRLRLIVEELFINTVHHGFGRDDDSPVNVDFKLTEDGIHLRYQDAAPPFDLVQYLAQFSQNFPSTVTVGGLGLQLIRGLCQQLDYQRIGPLNVTCVLL